MNRCVVLHRTDVTSCALSVIQLPHPGIILILLKCSFNNIRDKMNYWWRKKRFWDIVCTFRKGLVQKKQKQAGGRISFATQCDIHAHFCLHKYLNCGARLHVLHHHCGCRRHASHTVTETQNKTLWRLATLWRRHKKLHWGSTLRFTKGFSD